MSPSDLGRLVWIRTQAGEWYGPCLSVDVARRTDFIMYVNDLHEIAEVSDSVRALFGFESSIMGEAWVGACPPHSDSVAQPYRVEPRYTTDLRHESFYPYPAQQWPEDCKMRARMQ